MQEERRRRKRKNTQSTAEKKTLNTINVNNEKKRILFNETLTIMHTRAIFCARFMHVSVVVRFAHKTAQRKRTAVAEPRHICCTVWEIHKRTNMSPWWWWCVCMCVLLCAVAGPSLYRRYTLSSNVWVSAYFNFFLACLSLVLLLSRLKDCQVRFRMAMLLLLL